MEQQWVVSLAPYPTPDFTGVVITPRMGALLDLWAEHVVAVGVAGTGDFEDFFEQAARLEAAVGVFGAANVWLMLGSDAQPRNLVSGVTCAREALLAAGAGEYGIIYRMMGTGPMFSQNELAGAYLGLGAFAAHAGRRVAVAGHHPDRGGADLFPTIRAFGDAGVGRVIVKSAHAKYVFETLDLWPGMTDDAIYEQFGEDTGWALVHLEGLSNAFLVQTWVPMGHEYRFFVVDNELVTGAGCVEEFTPLNNAARFDEQMRGVRRERGPVTAAPEILAAYMPFAQRVVGDLRLEQPGLRHYVLDVAMGADGPLVVELNGLYNSGLYASDPRFVTRALAAAKPL